MLSGRRRTRRALLPACMFAALAQPALAADCWTPKAVGAARVRELQLMLTAVTLRCNKLNPEMGAAMDRFQVAQRVALEAADKTLREHFRADASKPGRLAYDSFQVGVLTFYGTGKTNTQSCLLFANVLDALGNPAANADTLATYAMHMVRDPRLKGERCPRVADKPAP